MVFSVDVLERISVEVKMSVFMYLCVFGSVQVSMYVLIYM